MTPMFIRARAYYYVAQSLNDEDKLSHYSNEASATALPDNIAPEVIGVRNGRAWQDYEKLGIVAYLQSIGTDDDEAWDRVVFEWTTDDPSTPDAIWNLIGIDENPVEFDILEASIDWDTSQLDPNLTYTIRATAYDRSGNEGSKERTYLMDHAIPDAPQNLTAKSLGTTNLLQWSNPASSNAVRGYAVYKGFDSAPEWSEGRTNFINGSKTYVKIDEIDKADILNQYRDNYLESGDYFYAVKSVNDAGNRSDPVFVSVSAYQSIVTNITNDSVNLDTIQPEGTWVQVQVFGSLDNLKGTANVQSYGWWGGVTANKWDFDNPAIDIVPGDRVVVNRTYANWSDGEPNNDGDGQSENAAVMNWAPSPDGGTYGDQWNDLNENGWQAGIIEILPAMEKPVPPTLAADISQRTVRSETGNVYFKVSPKKWVDAEAAAQAVGGHLVTINDNAEEQWIKQIFGANEYFWLGYNDIGDEGNWKWSSGEQPMVTDQMIVEELTGSFDVVNDVVSGTTGIDNDMVVYTQKFDSQFVTWRYPNSANGIYEANFADETKGQTYNIQYNDSVVSMLRGPDGHWTAVDAEVIPDEVAPSVLEVRPEQNKVGLYAWLEALGTDNAAWDKVKFEYSSDSGQSWNFIGEHESPWSSWEGGTGDGEFNAPEDVAVDANGNIYVSELRNNRIQKFDSSGNFITKWGTEGSEDGQFRESTDLAVDLNGNVYVTDFSNNRIQKFDTNGTFLAKWNTNSPTGIAVDNNGNVYVTDHGNSRIQKFDSNGNFITSWGGEGNGDGQLANPEGVAVDQSGNVYVADSQNNRIQKFDSNGSFIAKWGSYGSNDGEIDFAEDVFVDSNGNIFVVDRGNGRIQKWDSNGNFITKWGTEGSDDGQFNQATGIANDLIGNVYVADRGNHRIQKFDSNGSFITKWGNAREVWHSNIDWGTEGLPDGNYIIKATAFDYWGNPGSLEKNYYLDKTPPDTPTNLKATPGQGYIDLNWNPSAAQDTAWYNVYKSTEPGAGQFGWWVASIDAGSTYFRDNESSFPSTVELAVSPNFINDKTIFAGTEEAGIFKSANGGDSWTQVNNGLTYNTITSLSISPNFANDNTIFVGTSRSGVFKSTNGGNTWNPANNGLDDPVQGDPDSGSVLENVYFWNVAVSPNFANDNTLFAGFRDMNHFVVDESSGIYKSTDGGQTWTMMNTGRKAFFVTNLVVSPNYANDNTVFLSDWAGDNRGIFRSTDGGQLWTDKNNGLNDFPWGADLVVSPNFANDSTLFFGGEMGIYKSTNRGDSWNVAGMETASSDSRSLAVSPNFANDGTIFADAWGSISKSTDGGNSGSVLIGGQTSDWSFFGPDLAISPSYTNDNTVFATVQGDIIKSTDGGQTWNPLNAGSGTGTTYYYTVTATDDVRNESGSSNEASAMASADITSPKISFISPPTPKNNSTIYTTALSIPIEATVNDDGTGIDSSKLFVKLNNATVSHSYAPPTVSASITPKPNLPNKVEITATDKAGNSSVSAVKFYYKETEPSLSTLNTINPTDIVPIEGNNFIPTDLIKIFRVTQQGDIYIDLVKSDGSGKFTYNYKSLTDFEPGELTFKAVGSFETQALASVNVNMDFYPEGGTTFNKSDNPTIYVNRGSNTAPIGLSYEGPSSGEISIQKEEDSTWFSGQWQTQGIQTGAYTITATAKDSYGSTLSYSANYFVIEETQPDLSLTFIPQSGLTLERKSPTDAIGLKVVAGTSVQTVSFSYQQSGTTAYLPIDSTSVTDKDSVFTMSFNTSPLSDGPIKIKAVPNNDDSKAAVASYTLKTKPTLSLFPEDGSIIYPNPKLSVYTKNVVSTISFEYWDSYDENWIQIGKSASDKGWFSATWQNYNKLTDSDDLVDGALYTVRVTADDNESSAVYATYLYKSGYDLSIESPLNNSTLTSNPTVWMKADEGVESVKMYVSTNGGLTYTDAKTFEKTPSGEVSSSYNIATKYPQTDYFFYDLYIGDINTTSFVLKAVPNDTEKDAKIAAYNIEKPQLKLGLKLMPEDGSTIGKNQTFTAIGETDVKSVSFEISTDSINYSPLPVISGNSIVTDSFEKGVFTVKMDTKELARGDYYVKATSFASGSSGATVVNKYTFDDKLPKSPSLIQVTYSDQKAMEIHWADPKNQSSDRIGYNIYRSTTSFDTTNTSSFNVETLTPLAFVKYDGTNSSYFYNDWTVETGNTYYYIVAAIDSAGNISEASNERSNDVPTNENPDNENKGGKQLIIPGKGGETVPLKASGEKETLDVSLNNLDMGDNTTVTATPINEDTANTTRKKAILDAINKLDNEDGVDTEQFGTIFDVKAEKIQDGKVTKENNVGAEIEIEFNTDELEETSKWVEDVELLSFDGGKLTLIKSQTKQEGNKIKVQKIRRWSSFALFKVRRFKESDGGGPSAPDLTNPITQTFTSTDTNRKVDLSTYVTKTDTQVTATIPTTSISAGTSAGTVSFGIPMGTTITAPTTAWDGKINAPTTPKDTTKDELISKGLTIKAVNIFVIEIGAGDIPLTLDKAARIVFEGQKGKKIGYLRAGVFTPITTKLSADTQAQADALADGADGYYESDNDLIVWTKHFTEFVTYQLDETAPTLTMAAKLGTTTKGSNSYVRKTLSISGISNDIAKTGEAASGLKNVMLYVYRGSTLVKTSSYSLNSYKFNVDTTKLRNVTHKFLVIARDNVGNPSSKYYYFYVDNTKPRTYAPYSKSVKRYSYVKLYYKIYDAISPKANTRIIIKNSKGKTVKTLLLGLKDTNIRKYYNYKAALAKGTYRFYVYATDRAGNAQGNVAYNKLVIY